MITAQTVEKIKDATNSFVSDVTLSAEKMLGKKTTLSPIDLAQKVQVISHEAVKNNQELVQEIAKNPHDISLYTKWQENNIKIFNQLFRIALDDVTPTTESQSSGVKKTT